MPRPTGNHKGPRTKAQKERAAEVRLLGPAIRERWPIPARKRGPLADVAIKTALDGKAPTTDRLRALAVIAGMDQANQKDEQTANENFRLDQGKVTGRIAVEPLILERPI